MSRMIILRTGNAICTKPLSPPAMDRNRSHRIAALPLRAEPRMAKEFTRIHPDLLILEGAEEPERECPHEFRAGAAEIRSPRGWATERRGEWKASPIRWQETQRSIQKRQDPHFGAVSGSDASISRLSSRRRRRIILDRLCGDDAERAGTGAGYDVAGRRRVRRLRSRHRGKDPGAAGRQRQIYFGAGNTLIQPKSVRPLAMNCTASATSSNPIKRVMIRIPVLPM